MTEEIENKRRGEQPSVRLKGRSRINKLHLFLKVKKIPFNESYGCTELRNALDTSWDIERWLRGHPFVEEKKSGLFLLCTIRIS